MSFPALLSYRSDLQQASWSVESEKCGWIQMKPMKLPMLIHVSRNGLYVCKNQASQWLKTFAVHMLIFVRINLTYYEAGELEKVSLILLGEVLYSHFDVGLPSAPSSLANIQGVLPLGKPFTVFFLGNFWILAWYGSSWKSLFSTPISIVATSFCILKLCKKWKHCGP